MTLFDFAVPLKPLRYLDDECLEGVAGLVILNRATSPTAGEGRFAEVAALAHVGVVSRNTLGSENLNLIDELHKPNSGVLDVTGGHERVQAESTDLVQYLSLACVVIVRVLHEAY